METSEELSFSGVRKSIAEHLKTALGFDSEFSISYADHQESSHTWKVNVEYKKKSGGIVWPTSAAIIVDDKTGKVKKFLEGRRWA